MIVWTIFLPDLGNSAADGLTGKELADARSAFRTILVQVLLGLGILIAAIYAARRFELARSEHELERDKATTGDYTRAVEQLASDHLAERLGGIYALGRIAQSSPRDHWTIMQVLTAWLRDQSKLEADPEGAVREDFHAVGAVLRDRAHEHDGDGNRLNLRGVNLRQADLQGAHLEEAYMKGAVLGSARLVGAHLERATLWSADLGGANLTGANLGGADFGGAILGGAILERADLESANLESANLGGADLEGANLMGANLKGAHLMGANLKGANLVGAALEEAELWGTGLGGASFSTDTEWPVGFNPAAHGAIGSGGTEPRA